MRRHLGRAGGCWGRQKPLQQPPVHNALPYRSHFNMRLPLPSLMVSSHRVLSAHPSTSCPPSCFLTMLLQLVLPLLALGDTETSSSEIASSRQSDGYGAPYAPPQQYQVTRNSMVLVLVLVLVCSSSTISGDCLIILHISGISFFQ